MPLTNNVPLADHAHRAAWQRWLDETLSNWLRDPSRIADEGIEPPSETVLRLAADLAAKLRDEGRSPPTSVVCDPNGGVVFEWRDGDAAEVCHVWDDGSVEFMRFEGTRLVERRPG